MSHCQARRSADRISSNNPESVYGLSFRRSFRGRVKRTLRSNSLSILTFLGVLIGCSIGIGAHHLRLSDDVKLWISLPGTIYLRLLQLTILPMIAGRVLLVTAGLNPKQHGRMGVVALIYVVLANFLGSAIGFSIGLMMRRWTARQHTEPRLDTLDQASLSPTTSDIFVDLLYNLFPENILAIGLYNTETHYVAARDNTSNLTALRIVDSRLGTNMIGLLFASTLIGLASQKVGEKSRALLEFFDSTATIIEQIVKWVLKLTPVGVCFMISGAIVSIRTDLSLVMTKLAWFFVTLIIGLFTQMIVICLLVVVVTKRNPVKFFFQHSVNAYLITIATGVPLVAVPHIYEACDKNGISTRVSRFVAPLGAVLKSDGSALFIMTALVFATSIANVENLTSLGIASLICSVLSFAIPPVPSASILLIMTILKSMNVDSGEALGMLFAIDWLTDRLRSGNNTISTLACILLTNHIGQHFDPQALPLLQPIDETVNELDVDEEIPVSLDDFPRLETGLSNFSQASSKT